ncbi:hypothetical protein [Clostridium sp.]|uniref:hypothetical protein n=1 Tax=Clostridium sp. TaxID=1506 RepID=UPI0032174F75
MVYLVSYDLNTPGKNYNELYNKLKSFNSYLHPLESTWFIDTLFSAKEIFERLYPVLDSNDKLFVVKLDTQWHALLAQSNYDWLHKFLG